MQLNVSLLIPAYNAERHLPAILQDAHSQNPPFTSILVYDDCSSDNTAAVARSLGVHKVLVGKENRGPAYARNRLIEACETEWIHFHDADDRLDHLYTRVMERLHPGDNEVIICGLKTYDSISGRYGAEYDAMQLDRCSDLNVFLKSQYQLGSGLYPRRLLNAIHGFREDLRGAEDFDIHIRLALHGAAFRAIPDRLNTYCRHGGTTFTESSEGRLNSDWLVVYNDYLATLPQEYRGPIADLTMELAYKLHRNGQLDEMDAAIKLASAHGVKSVRSSWRSVELLSRVVGVKAMFRLRDFRDLLLNKTSDPGKGDAATGKHA